MKRIRLIRGLAILGIALAVGFNLYQRLKPEDLSSEMGSLKEVFSSASSFSGKKGTPPIYEAYDAKGEIAGVVFSTEDLTPEIAGYGGRIKILVGLNKKGDITGVKILEHSETPSYVQAFYEDWYLNQFKGINVNGDFRLGKGIDAITGATITSRAVNRSVGIGARKVASEYLGIALKPAGGIAEEETLKGAREKAYLHTSILLAFLAFAFISSFNNIKPLRYAALVFALLYLGFIKAALSAMVNLAQLGLWKIPLMWNSLFLNILILFTLVSGLLFGRVYCGWICPFGALQELLKRVIPFEIKIKGALDREGKRLKYGILWMTLLGVFLLNSPAIADFEPYGAIFSQVGGALIGALLAASLAGSAFIYRFWCRFLCPEGALYAIMSNWKGFKIRAIEERVSRNISGDRPDAPMQAVVDRRECILCNQCSSGCGMMALGGQVKKAGGRI